MSVYLISADTLFNFCDWRVVAKNILDTEPGSVATLAQLTNTSSAAGARLQTLIGSASEMLLAAACGQARYSLADIQTYGGGLRDMIVAWLTVGPILARRERPGDDEESLALSYKMAVNYLEQLQNGERIFYAVPNVPEAGLPATATMCPQPGFNPPTFVQKAGRYFGNAGGGCGSCG